MEDTALDTLRTMLAFRKLDTSTERLTTDNKKMEKVTLYTIGTVLVCFSQKDKILSTDITNVLAFAEENGHTTGIIIVAMSPPSENVLRVAKSHSKKRLALFHIWQLQTTAIYGGHAKSHRMTMPHRILAEDERTEIFDRFKISEPENQLPWIDSQDPQIKWIGAIPGDVVEVTRHSDTAGRSFYYRYCVEDKNVAQ
jgi:DNA-directed RNA polymerase subunit H (RpoH/RPB5)